MNASGELDTVRVDDQDLPDASKFKPKDCTSMRPDLQLPDEIWLTMLASPCTFPPDIFSGVMLNLISNPNVTSSHLFRADILYDSGENLEHDDHGEEKVNLLLKQMKAEYRPREAKVPDYTLLRTMVRRLIPRNPQLDPHLIQTCHIFQRLGEDGEERNLVLYLPHIDEADQMPFYHPTVRALAFHHIQPSPSESSPGPASWVTVSYSLFPDTTLTPKHARTALRLLQTVHKHGQGRLAGYAKRVHLDRILPQKRYQDRYTQLKAKYGRQLSEQWVEVTDPGKHVFEDIGIAAFLIELWGDMYHVPHSLPIVDLPAASPVSKPPFPGFVDMGCGNGILVFILLSEGYAGSGFDARTRKTWSIFPAAVQAQLEQKILVPAPLLPEGDRPAAAAQSWHTGLLPSAREGRFIISNHADELTLWTPLLAYMNDSAFLAIPCCSHDLSGARFRAPMQTVRSVATGNSDREGGGARLPQQNDTPDPPTCRQDEEQRPGNETKSKNSHAAETGSLRRTDAQKKMPSAYASLCSYVGSLAEEVGFEPENDVLRIPSTRNHCIVGRRRRSQDGGVSSRVLGVEEKGRVVSELVERELGRGIGVVGEEWVARAEKLAKKPGSGH